MDSLLSTLMQLVASLLLIVQNNPTALTDAQKSQAISFANNAIQMVTQTSTSVTTSSISPTVTNNGTTGAVSNTVSSVGASCNQSLLSQTWSLASAPVLSSVGNSSISVTQSQACQTIGKDWVAAFYYKDGSGNCYKSDMNGTTPMACSAVSALTGYTPPVWTGNTPPNPSSADFNWQAAGATCVHTVGDTGLATYGQIVRITCGLNVPAGVNSSTVLAYCSNHSSDASCPGNNTSGGVGTTNPVVNPVTPVVSGTVKTNNGTTGTITNTAANVGGSCNQSLLSQTWPVASAPISSTVGGGVINGVVQSGNISVTQSQACQTIGKDWVAVFYYMNSAGTCYKSDMNGTTPMSCTAIEALTGYVPPVWTGNTAPNPLDQNFNWQASGATCVHTVGDTGLATYGQITRISCGFDTHAGTYYSQSKYCQNYSSDQSCTPVTVAGSTGTISTNNGTTGTITNTVSSVGASCNQSLLSQTWPVASASIWATVGGGTISVTQSQACQTIGKDWVAAFYYKDGSGNCYKSDMNGTTAMACSAVSALTGYNPPVWTGNTPPNPFNPNFNWQASGATCVHTVGDLGLQTYGQITSISCGFDTHAGTYATTADVYCKTHTNDSSCTQVGSASNNSYGGIPYSSAPIATSTSSASPAYYACQTNSDCGDPKTHTCIKLITGGSYCVNYTLNY